MDPGASQNRSSLLATSANSGRGQPGSPWADPGADQRRQLDKKLLDLTEPLDPAVPSAHFKPAWGEVSRREGASPGTGGDSGVSICTCLDSWGSLLRPSGQLLG